MFLGEDADKIPEVKLFNEWMKKTDPNQSVDLFALYGWLSARLFVDAMQQDGHGGADAHQEGLDRHAVQVGIVGRQRDDRPRQHRPEEAVGLLLH